MPNLSLQFFRKSMMQEVLPPSSCRDISISCRSRYFSIRQLSRISWFINRAFENVKRLFIEEAHRSFIKRYLKRNDIMCNISSCDAILTIGIGHVPRSPCGLSSFIYPCYHVQLSVSICILKQTQDSERNRHIEIQALVAATSSQRGQGPNP